MNKKGKGQNAHDHDDVSATDVIKAKDTFNLISPPGLQEKKSQESGSWEGSGNSREKAKVTYGLSLKEQIPREETKVNVGGGYINFKQSEHLRIAQKKMNDLEEKMNRLSRENEDIASAAETI